MLTLTMKQSLRLKQELTLQQQLRQEIKQQLQLTQKMELKLYLKMQEFFQSLYDEAEKRTYDQNGLCFEHAVIRQKDLPSNFPPDAGFCIIYYDFFTGEATKTLRFVVKDFCSPFPKEYQGIVAVHEYGESLLIGHQESSVLEWGMAKKESFLGSYLEWMEGAAPAKLADLSKYSVLWDMMPDEVMAAAERMLIGSAERESVLGIMKGLQMPGEVRISCARFDGFKSHAQEIVDIMASRAQIILESHCTHQERVLAARFAMQLVAAQLARKGQPWLAHAMDAGWREAVSSLNKESGNMLLNARQAYAEKLLQDQEESERKSTVTLLEDFSEPLMAVLPATLQQAMELERMVARLEARIIGSMGAKGVLKEYLKLAGSESRKTIRGEDEESRADTPAKRSAKRFVASYILLRGISKLSELELDYASAGEITPQLVKWWEKSISALNRRYARENAGLPLFTKNDPPLSMGLRGLMSFHDEYCVPRALRKSETKKIVFRGEKATFSGRETRTPKSLQAA